MQERILLGRTNELKSHFDDGLLPSKLEELRHQLEWPVDFNLHGFHIANYFRDKDYINPIFWPHYGIDIQVPVGTQVKSITTSRLVCFSGRDVRNLGDLEFLNENGLVIRYLHLNPRKIPKKFAIRYWNNNNPEVNQGTPIGVVGAWPKWGEPNNEKIPDDVRNIYGTSYHHLHLEMQVVSTDKLNDQLSREMVLGMTGFNLINPLLLLKEI